MLGDARVMGGTSKPSTLWDVEQGKRTEFDALNGPLLREAQQLGIPTPYYDALSLLLKGVEKHSAQTSGARRSTTTASRRRRRRNATALPWVPGPEGRSTRTKAGGATMTTLLTTTTIATDYAARFPGSMGLRERARRRIPTICPSSTIRPGSSRPFRLRGSSRASGCQRCRRSTGPCS